MTCGSYRLADLIHHFTHGHVPEPFGLFLVRQLLLDDRFREAGVAAMQERPLNGPRRAAVNTVLVVGILHGTGRVDVALADRASSALICHDFAGALLVRRRASSLKKGGGGNCIKQSSASRRCWVSSSWGQDGLALILLTAATLLAALLLALSLAVLLFLSLLTALTALTALLATLLPALATLLATLATLLFVLVLIFLVWHFITPC
jgi:hypothetical protein